MEHLLDLFKFFPEAFEGQGSPQIIECLKGGPIGDRLQSLVQACQFSVLIIP